MKPENVIGAILAHSQHLTVGEPDQALQAVRHKYVGKTTPANIREIKDDKGKVDVAQTWPAIRTAFGRSTRGLSKSSLEEYTAEALTQMPKRYWQTLQVAIHINDLARDSIHAKLIKLGRKSQERGGYWPKSIRRRRSYEGREATPDYLVDLVNLAVLELEKPALFGSHKARAAWFGVSERNWYIQMQRPYGEISGYVWNWYHCAIGHIESRLAKLRRLESGGLVSDENTKT